MKHKTAELDKIRQCLSTTPRDLLLFELVLQTDVPVKSLLKLKYKDIEHLSIGDELPLPDKPENNREKPFINELILGALQLLLKERSLNPHDYLLQSRKGSKALSVQSVSRIIRGWMEETGLNHINGLRGLRSARRRSMKMEQDRRDLKDNDKKNVTPEIANPDSEEPENILPKIHQPTLQETVYKELEKAIVSGRFAPGRKLVTEDIARTMDVSRIPVREAMGRLEARGFITTRAKWGSMVNELSCENLSEILELRLLLEPEAVAKAVRKSNPSFLINLEKAYHAYAQAKQGSDTNLLLQTNREFHFLIYQQAHSPMLFDIITQLWDRVSPYYHIMFRQLPCPELSTEIRSYHDVIVEGMKNSDTQKAKEGLKADLHEAACFILKLFTLYQKDTNKFY